MSEEFAIVVEGLESIKELEDLGGKVRYRAAQAINKAARDGRSMIAVDIRDEINVPADYLNPSQGRLIVSQQATADSLEARIRARSKPTSLARFVVGNPQVGKEGVTVQVNKRPISLKRAFLIKLRSGAGYDSGTQFNRGLAIRLRPGDTIRNKRHLVKLKGNLYLLYGPSVQQVFLNNEGTGVAADDADPIASKMETEFLRLMDR